MVCFINLSLSQKILWLMLTKKDISLIDWSIISIGLVIFGGFLLFLGDCNLNPFQLNSQIPDLTYTLLIWK